jgi:hypothetical protein
MLHFSLWYDYIDAFQAALRMMQRVREAHFTQERGKISFWVVSRIFRRFERLQQIEEKTDCAFNRKICFFLNLL